MVRILDAERLHAFRATWRFHHPLSEVQLAYGGRTASVEAVGFYHGGDVLYELCGIPGIWHEACLQPAS